MIAQKIGIKNLSLNKALLLFPAALLTATTACFAPHLLLTVPVSAFFYYFWNHKDKFVYFLLIYAPFEEIVLRLIPGSFYAPVRYMWEIMLVGMMVLTLLENILLSRRWKRSPIDMLAVVFIAVWFLSAAAGSKSFIFSLAHLKNIIRYIPLFYIVYNLKPDKKLLSTIINIIIIMAVVQSAICFAQTMEGNDLVEIFRPKNVVVNNLTIRGPDIQEGTYYTRFTGSFDRTIHLGNYLAFAICLATGAYFGAGQKRYLLLLIAILAAALYISSSRISWISAFAGVGVILFRIRHKFRFAYFLAPVTILLFLISGAGTFDDETMADDFKILDRFIYVFTPDYVDVAGDAGRLYTILNVAPAVISASPILGLGPGTFMQISEQMTDEEIYGAADKYDLGSPALRYVPDVGYVAIFVQTGILGLISLFWIFARIFKIVWKAISSTTEAIPRAFFIGSVGFLVALAVQNWASFNLMYRNQSVIIWIVLGLAALFATDNTSGIEPNDRTDTSRLPDEKIEDRCSQ